MNITKGNAREIRRGIAFARHNPKMPHDLTGASHLFSRAYYRSTRPGLVTPPRDDAGMVRPAPLVDRLLTARDTPNWNDELATTAAVALCAGPNGTMRLIQELVSRIEDNK